MELFVFPLLDWTVGLSNSSHHGGLRPECTRQIHHQVGYTLLLSCTLACSTVRCKNVCIYVCMCLCIYIYIYIYVICMYVYM